MWVWSYFRDGIIVDVDDFVEVSSDDHGHIVQPLEVKHTIVDKAVEGYGGQVADSHLIRSTVLHYLCTQVARLDRAKVLWEHTTLAHHTYLLLASTDTPTPYIPVGCSSYCNGPCTPCKECPSQSETPEWQTTVFGL